MILNVFTLRNQDKIWTTVTHEGTVQLSHGVKITSKCFKFINICLQKIQGDHQWGQFLPSFPGDEGTACKNCSVMAGINLAISGLSNLWCRTQCQPYYYYLQNVHYCLKYIVWLAMILPSQLPYHLHCMYQLSYCTVAMSKHIHYSLLQICQLILFLL